MTVLCSRPRRWKVGSWLIMRLQGLPFSHVALTVNDQRLGIRKVYESKSPIAQMSALERFLEKNQVIEAYAIYVDGDAARYAELRAIMSLGSPYSFKALLGKLIEISSGHFPSWALDGSASSICCEYLARALNADEIDPERVDLVDFKRWLQKNGRAVPAEVIEDLNGR